MLYIAIRVVTMLLLLSALAFPQYVDTKPSTRDGAYRNETHPMDSRGPMAPTYKEPNGSSLAPTELDRRKRQLQRSGDIYFRKQQWTEAKQCYQQALDVAPHDRSLRKKLNKTEAKLAASEPINQKTTGSSQECVLTSKRTTP